MFVNFVNNSINIFVPVYNELSSINKIEQNVRRVLKVFPDACFFFYDNASVDGTSESLLQLQQKYPQNISVKINPENIGFQKNLSKISELPKNKMILIFGANDQIYTPGLRKLQSILVEGEHDLVVCNTCYVTGNSRLKLLKNEDERVKAPFCTNSLDEFFQKGGAIPNGIMQYVIHPRHSHIFSTYDFMMSPQVGVFFDVFPGKICYLPPPPIALVHRVESTGWRSTKEGIIETHLVLAKDVLELACRAYNMRQMSPWTFLLIRFAYTHAVMFLIYKAVTKKDYWGGWHLKGTKKYEFLLRMCKEVFSMPPFRWMNLIIVFAVAVDFLKYKITAPFRKPQIEHE